MSEGVKGRVPKPIEQKRREGNPGKRALPEPLVLAGGSLARPAELPPAAAQLWDELVAILERAGVVDGVDRPALQALCLQWQRAEDARAALDEFGMFSVGSTGQLVEHPAVAIEARAHTLLLRFAEQYGLTAAARARIAHAASAARANLEAEKNDVLDLTPQVLE
jgi:P27 family predicted phage terminase small subunit